VGIDEVKQEYAIKLVNRIQQANEYNNLKRSVLEQAVINPYRTNVENRVSS